MVGPCAQTKSNRRWDGEAYRWQSLRCTSGRGGCASRVTVVVAPLSLSFTFFCRHGTIIIVFSRLSVGSLGRAVCREPERDQYLNLETHPALSSYSHHLQSNTSYSWNAIDHRRLSTRTRS